LSSPSVVFARVSVDACASNPSPTSRVTVRQTPSVAIDSPRTSALNGQPISKTMPPSARRFPRMVPTAWTSPVNILIPTRFPLLSAGAVSRESAADEKIRAERARLHVFEADGLAHRRDAKRGKKAHRIASAEDARGDEGRN